MIVMNFMCMAIQVWMNEAYLFVPQYLVRFTYFFKSTCTIIDKQYMFKYHKINDHPAPEVRTSGSPGVPRTTHHVPNTGSLQCFSPKRECSILSQLDCRCTDCPQPEYSAAKNILSPGGKFT
ncbi:hypothetical protein CEXT_237901 [Caerostris extrusa]|uniref:Uncharacterized protein n=1 Tax=Caerostris extrusa TaxID=172846 RepID=A0AAV4XAX6_CAEEX|nr:hypothetical protein CEXT_237901 [Caerostris extrusa]